MALQFQNVSINFAGGEDSKSNEKLIPPTKLERAVNVRQIDAETIELRNGYDNLGNIIQGTSSTTSLSGGEALNVFNDEMLLFNNNQLYSRLSFNDRWIEKGPVVPVVADVKSVVRNSASQTRPDSDTLNGITVYAWDDSRGGVYISVIDEGTGNAIIADTTVAFNGSRPKVRAVGSYIFILFFNTATNVLQGIRYDPSSPISIPSAVNLVSGMDATGFYDVAKSSDVLCFVAYKSGGSIDVGYMDQTGAIPAAGRASTVNFVATVTDMLSVHIDPTNLDVYILYSNTASGGLFNIFSVNLGSSIGSGALALGQIFNGTCAFVTPNSADVIVEHISPAVSKGFSPANVNIGTEEITITSHPFQNGDAVTVSSTTTLPAPLAAATTYYVRKTGTNTLQLCVSLTDVLNANPINLTTTGVGTHTIIISEVTWRRFIYKLNVTRTGTVSGTTVLKRHMNLASKAFKARDVWYFYGLFDTDLQGTYFCLDINGNIIARVYTGQAGSRSDAYIPQAVERSSGSFSIAAAYRSNLLSENNKIISQTGVAEISLDFSSTDRYFADQLGPSLYIGGGFVSQYDGASTVEAGFHLYPEKVITGSGATTGGAMSAGNYQVTFVYAWTDIAGNIHRSAPMIPIQQNLTLGGTTCSITYEVPTLKLTAKTGNRANCIIEGYRTTSNGSVFRKFTSTTAPTLNDPTAEYASITATLSDTELLNREILYTTGNILENEPPPSAKYVAATKNRIVLYGTENEDLFYYSKEYSPGYGLGFSSLFSLPIDKDGGKPKGAIAMDDKIILFKERRIYYLAGDGPTDLGTENTFIRPELIASDTGLADSNSLVLTDFGVMFKSNKGIYLLDRSLNLSYIGADVEKYNSYTVTSADLLTDLNEVVFLTNGPALVFNYFTKQWQRWTNHEGVDAVTWQNKYNYLRTSAGYVYQENREKFLDDNSFIQMDVITAWIKLAGVQDFQRVQRNALAGNYFSEHVLQQEVGYDYNEAYPVIQTWDPSQEIQSGVWGDGATWGSDSVWGGIVDNVYQVRFHLPIQKCEAIRFRWKNLPRGSSPGKQLSLSNLTLRIGFKRGINKLREGKSV